MSAMIEKRHLASDPARSAWVSANAGAGKTRVLADRVTRLLLEGASPSRILCLTYTKAAAAEMAQRLFSRLGAWALLPDAELIAALRDIGAHDIQPKQLREARKLFARALETPGGLKIQTIHSFCQHVLARFPVEAGIPTRFQVLDERSADELMQAARNAVLSRAAAGETALAEAVGVLATRAGDGRFAEILNAAVGSGRGKLRELIAQHDGEENLFAAIRKTLGVRPGEDADDVVARFCKALGAERGQCERVAKWLLESTGKDDGKYGGHLIDFLNAGMAPHAIGKLEAIFLTEKGEPRARLATKKLADANPAHHEFLRKLQDRFVAFDRERRATAVATLTEAVITVADAVLEAYGRRKRARAALDYDDLTEATLALLEDKANAAWVLYKLDGGLDHILVDEAQDTSPEQWQIVARLVEDFFAGESARENAERAPTIFAVGDEKQSIFSFQGADPNAFADNLGAFEKRAKAARMAFEPVALAASYRGARDVLGFIDAVFASESARDGLTAAGGAIVHEAARQDIAGRVEVWPAVKAPPDAEEKQTGALDAPSADAAYKALAARIADRIKRWIDAGTLLPSTGKPVQPGDIMILVRRRNAFTEEMIRQLMDCKIAVAGADRMKLTEQIAIADLVALGRFALLPEDDLNLAALLKSPMIGFGEDELFDLAYAREGKLWPVLVKRKDEKPVFLRAYETLSVALANAGRAAPFEFYSQALSRGARLALIARLGAEAADAIDEFLALALAHESAHPPSLESFLDWFGRGASDVKRDMEQGGHAVRVMTVHGAKGLQAPIVIVPDTTQIPNQAAKAALLYAGDCVFFGVNKNLETEPVTKAKLAAHEAEMREYRRLLYVALTRAQDWLVVCGYETKLKPPVNPLSWYALVETAAKRVGREEKDIAGEPITIFGSSLSFARGETGAQTKAVSPPAFLRAAATRETSSQRILQPSQAAGAEEPPVFSPLVDEGYRFRRGLLVHALLAALPDVQPEARAHMALQFLTRRGVAEKEARALAGEALAVLDHGDFAALFAPGSRAEVPISVELPELGQGTRVSGQIDRLAVTGNAVLVADYKTNRPPPQHVNDVPALYVAQMALYRAALAKIYPAKKIACALVWTDGPILMHLPDALLDAEIAKITSRAMEFPAP